MSNTSYKTGKYTIPAGGAMWLDRAASYLICLEATAPFRVRFDNGSVSDFEAGLTIKQPKDFTKVEILNNGPNPLTIKLGFGRGDVRDSRMTVTGLLDTRADVADIFDGELPPLTAGAGSCVLAVAENINRAEVGISNTGGAVLWVKSSNIISQSGQPLDPGQSAIIATTADIYVCNTTATAGEFARWETGFSL